MDTSKLREDERITLASLKNRHPDAPQIAFLGSRLCECRKQVEELQRSQRTFAAEQFVKFGQSIQGYLGASGNYEVGATLLLSWIKERVAELRADEAQAQGQAGIKKESQSLCPKCKHATHAGKSCTFGGAHGFSDDACGCIADALEKKQ